VPHPRIPFKDLVAFGERLLDAAGDEARYLSETAVTAAAMGSDTHGLRQLLYLHRHLGGKIDPLARPSVKRSRGAMAWVDGRNAAGHIAARLCVERAMALAREHGVGFAGCGGTHWIGALGPFLLPVLDAGMLGIMQAQYSTGRDAAPVGGLDPRFATNPIALCIPGPGTGRVLADFSVTAYSHGRVDQMVRDGETAPAPVFLANNGTLSDDPNTFNNDGTMLFMAGDLNAHKGYALALWGEAMTALVGGDPNTPGVQPMQSVVVQVIDPAAFVGADNFAAKMRGFVEHLRTSRVRPGSDGIRLPGERALASLDAAKRHGVAVADDMSQKLRSAASEAGVVGW